MDEPLRASWFSRNKTWVIPVGCVLAIIGTCLAGGALTCGNLALKARRELTSGMQAQGEAVKKAQQSPEVQRVLGAPISAVPNSARPQYGNQNGNADLKILMGLQGPNGTATYRIHAVRRAGEEDWEFKQLEVEPEGGEPIDLVEGP